MHLVLVFTVAVGLYVIGMVVLALAAILGRRRGNRKLKKLEPELRKPVAVREQVVIGSPLPVAL